MKGDDRTVVPDKAKPPHTPQERIEYAAAYGIIRYMDPDGRKSWYVSIRRHGMQARRSFHDSAWGGEQEAFDAAFAYRQEIIQVLPPMTKRAVCTKLKKNNKSGVTGVRRIVSPSGKVHWEGYLSTPPMRRKSFPVAVHGEEGAKALAIAFREQALAEIENKFITYDPIAEKTANRQFSDSLHEPVSAMHRPLIGKDELMARVAEIDARYDAHILPTVFKFI